MGQHKRSAAGQARRDARRNMYASLMENCFGKEAGRDVTTVWATTKTGLVPVGLIDRELLKPERVHGGIVRYDIDVDRKGNIHLTGGLPDEDALTTKTVNKRGARLSQDANRRKNWK